MDNFQIETAQNISITQNVAGLGERILAYLIDGLIMIAYVVTMIFILSAMEVSPEQEWVFTMLLGLPLFLYFLLWEIFWDGCTPGKAAMEIRVVKLDGTKPAISNFLIRWLLRFVDITLSSGSVALVTILINGKGQRLGDLAAGTTVISEKGKTGFNNILFVDLPENYQPVYPQVTILSDKDVQEIKNLYKDSLIKANYRVISSLSAKVSQLLGVVPKSNASEFLKTVLRDYNYYTRQ